MMVDLEFGFWWLLSLFFSHPLSLWDFLFRMSGHEVISTGVPDFSLLTAILPRLGHSHRKIAQGQSYVYPDST